MKRIHVSIFAFFIAFSIIVAPKPASAYFSIISGSLSAAQSAVASGLTAIRQAVMPASINDWLDRPPEAGTPSSIVARTFGACFYCAAMAAVYDQSIAIGSSIGTVIAAAVKVPLTLIFAIWCVVTLIRVVLPFEVGRARLSTLLGGFIVFFVTNLVLSSYNGGDSAVKSILFDPIIQIGAAGPIVIIEGGAQLMPTLGAPAIADDPCVSPRTDGMVISCASWRAAQYAAAGLALGWAMVTTTLTFSDWIAVMLPWALTFSGGILMMAVWGWVMIRYPIAIVSFITRCAVFLVFSPLIIATLPFASARAAASKAVRGLIATAFSLWGMSVAVILVSIFMGSAFGVSGGEPLWPFIVRVSDGQDRWFAFSSRYFLVLFCGVLAVYALESVNRLVSNFIEDSLSAVDNVVSGAAGSMAAATLKTGAMALGGAAIGARMASMPSAGSRASYGISSFARSLSGTAQNIKNQFAGRR